MLKHYMSSYRKRLFYGLVIVGLILGVVFALFSEKSYYVVLPVGFKRNGTPYVETEIQGSLCHMQVDLGSRLEMGLRADVLRNFQKVPCGTEKFKNFRGVEFAQPAYIIPNIRLGSFVFDRPLVVESLKKGETTLWNNSTANMKVDPDVGSLGRGLLKQVNLLFDMGRSKIIVTNSPKKLKKNGYNIQSFVRVPFVLDAKGILVDFETDLGSLKLMLDTGCTITALHAELRPTNGDKQKVRNGIPAYTSDSFVTNGTDFGSLELYFIPMAKELRVFDGILGMDFIEKHVMYVDFANNCLYIEK